MKNKLNLPSKIHFIGIGGAGMNPLAGICLKEGIKVTGSDKNPSDNQTELKALGADIWNPHSAEELVERELPEVCIYSTAIPADNPEVIYLKEKNVKFWHRSDLLEKIANNFEKQIVIAGTHGKTTTTAMLVWILEKADLNPCWVLGGVLKGLGSYGWSDQREIFVFEGDENDQSFLKSKPYIGVVTSLEPDNTEQIKKFQEFSERSKHLVWNLDCYKYLEECSRLCSAFYGRAITDSGLYSLGLGSKNSIHYRAFDFVYLEEENCVEARPREYSIYLGTLGTNENNIEINSHLINILGASMIFHQLSGDADEKNQESLLTKFTIPLQIHDLVHKSLTDYELKDSLDYDILTSKQAVNLQNRIKQNTGKNIDFKKYKRYIDSETIRKINRKYGFEKDTNKSLEAITEIDYENLLEILHNPDSIEYLSKGRKYKLQIFRYKKAIKGIIYIVEEVLAKKKKINLLNIYKKKIPRRDTEPTFKNNNNNFESDYYSLRKSFVPSFDYFGDEPEKFNPKEAKYEFFHILVLQKAFTYIQDFELIEEDK